MARKDKPGLDYFPLDCDLFGNSKVDALTDIFGAHGLMLLIYLYCQIYDSEGYYMVFDDSNLSYLQTKGFEKKLVDNILTYLNRYGFFTIKKLDPTEVYGNFDYTENSFFDYTDSEINNSGHSNILSCEGSDVPIAKQNGYPLNAGHPNTSQDPRIALLITGRSVQEQYQKSSSSGTERARKKVDANLWLLTNDETYKCINVSNKDNRFKNLEPLSQTAYDTFVFECVEKRSNALKNVEVCSDASNCVEKRSNASKCVTKRKEKKVKETKLNKNKPNKTKSKQNKLKTNDPPSSNDTGGLDPKDPPEDPDGSKKNDSTGKKKNQDKKPYGECGLVMLSDSDVEYVKKKCKGYQPLIDLVIDKLDSYKASSGREYKSDKDAIRTWVFGEACKDMGLDPNNLVVPKPKQELIFGETPEEFKKHAAEFSKAQQEALAEQEAHWQETHPNQPNLQAENFSDLVGKVTEKIGMS